MTKPPDKPNLMYSVHAEEYAKAIEDNFYNARYERPILFSMLPSVEGLDVLDMGCGPGVYSRELAKLGARVTAVDGSREMISMLQSTLGTAIKAYVQDLEDGLPKEQNRSFDLVISPLVIHYISDLLRLFREVARVLRPGGTFVFSTHHPMVDFKDSKSGNYFRQETLTQTWDTIGEPMEIQFYRRPLTDLFHAIENAGMAVVSLNEGAPDENIQRIAHMASRDFLTNPTFIFLECRITTTVD